MDEKKKQENTEKKWRVDETFKNVFQFHWNIEMPLTDFQIYFMDENGDNNLAGLTIGHRNFRIEDWGYGLNAGKIRVRIE